MAEEAQNLGIHKYIKRKCDDDGSRRIKYLQHWRGKIYMGYGAWAPNRGPVSINYYSPTNSGFGTETVYVDDNNQNEIFLLEDCISRYVIIDSELYIPGIDAMPGPDFNVRHWDLGNYYHNDGTGWRKKTIPNAIHNFDMIGYKGELYAALGSDQYSLQRYSDNEDKWVPAIDSTGGRFKHLFKISGDLYAVNPRGKVFKYDNSTTKFLETTWNLIPGSNEGIACIVKTGGRIYYIKENYNKVYTAVPEENGTELPKHNPDEKIYDLKVANSLLYVLTTVENNDDFTVVICTVDGTRHQKSVSTSLPSNARSMEILDGTIYLGTESGDVYSIPDNTQ